MKAPKFEEDKEDFDSFIERLESYFFIEKVNEDAKVHSLIMGLSSSQYQVAKNLVAPEKPASKSFENLVAILAQHYGGTTNARTERAKFRAVIRQEHETAFNYGVRLKMAARHCKFGQRLDEMLVDQLVQGVRSKTAVTKLLESDEGLTLSFAKAMEIAQNVLMTENNMHIYGGGESSSQVQAPQEGATATVAIGNVNKIEKRKWEPKRCFRCNEVGHFKYQCPQKSR